MGGGLCDNKKVASVQCIGQSKGHKTVMKARNFELQYELAHG